MTNFSPIQTNANQSSDSNHTDPAEDFRLGTPQSRSDNESRQLAMTIAEAMDDRKGGDITVLQVSDVSYVADYFVIATGFSNVQVRAVARAIEDKVETQWQQLPLRVEGFGEGSWVLMDYGDVIAHIFLPKEREFYSLEAFWGHADRVSLST
jgi:ribosome-associated protein